jgi:hypothetical protein
MTAHLRHNKATDLSHCPCPPMPIHAHAHMPMLMVMVMLEPMPVPWRCCCHGVSPPPEGRCSCSICGAVCTQYAIVESSDTHKDLV